MTLDEFNKYLKEVFGPRFPSVLTWLRKQPKETRKSGFALLEHIGVGDATKAADALHLGTVEPPKLFDDYLRTIRFESRRIAAERSQDDHVDDFRRDYDDRKARSRRGKAKWDMPRLMLAAVERSKKNKPTDDLFPPISDEDRPRHRCPVCSDYGLVTVWHPPTGTKAATACNCHVGDQWLKACHGSRYNAHGHVLVKSISANKLKVAWTAYVAENPDWEERQQKQTERRQIQEQPNYTSGFDAFNAGQETESF
jgi:hypothetical protein